MNPFALLSITLIYLANTGNNKASWWEWVKTGMKK
jgi:hypothetical protein